MTPKELLAARKKLELSPTEMARAMGVSYDTYKSHEPPHPWTWGGKIVGSRIIGRYVESSPFDLVVTGHFHERQLREDVVANTPVINPMDTGCLVRITAAGKSFEILQSP